MKTCKMIGCTVYDLAVMGNKDALKAIEERRKIMQEEWKRQSIRSALLREIKRNNFTLKHVEVKPYAD